LARKWQNFRKFVEAPTPQMATNRQKYTPKTLSERLARDIGKKNKRARGRQLYYNDEQETDDESLLDNAVGSVADSNSNDDYSNGGSSGSSVAIA
jgi:uncharacterized protein YaiI (UPF0178 family)